MVAILWQVIRRRRISLVWWCLGLVAFVVILAIAYPTVRDNSELDRTFAGLPPGVQTLLGLSAANTLTSPVGYLNSQYFANVLPLILLVFAIGLGAWAISGDEAAGTLELLLANPVSRIQVAIARAASLGLLLAILTAVAAAALVTLAPATGLNRGLPLERIVAATVACGFLALAFAAVAFAVGAALGKRSIAMASGATLAIAGYVIEGLAAQVKVLQPIRAASPWHWLIDSDPLRHGLLPESWLLPLAVSLILIALSTVLFARRDLR
ncbi:MAG: ABC transporter permease subunit [Candidatus Dormibacter sp.]